MQQITTEEVKNRLKNGEDIHLLDVRETEEREEANIGGRHLPLGDIRNMEISSVEDWKEEEVIVYCRSGNRSAYACMFLEQQGFTNVKNLSGGILEWNK